MSHLPLYHKRRKGPLKAKETYLLMLLFLTFTLAWCLLIFCMPQTQTIDSGFEATYQKFIHRSLEEVRTTDIADTDGENVDPPKLNVPLSKEPPIFIKTPPSESTTDNGLTLPSEGTEVSLSSLPSKAVESDLIAQERKQKVKEMIKHAWDGYVKYAFGENELKPLSKSGHSAPIFGKTKVGATLVDSLDTLFIAGLMDEFNKAKKWVEESFNISEIDSFISFFEFNIRFIGGFLSAYALSGEEVFKRKAISLADKLMPVFNPETGLPSSFVNMNTGATKNWNWAKTSSILSEIGTLHLEYQYLTELTNNPIYLDKVNHIRKKLKDMQKNNGMYYTLINQKSQAFGSKVSSLGALGDSFYEYLLKSWLITSKEDTEARDMYYDAIDALESKMLVSKPGGSLLVSDFRSSRNDQTMQHLACFSGGMFALGSVNAENSKETHYMSVAKNITRACHMSYSSTATHLGPEKFRVDDHGTYSSRRATEKVYLLRPETVESYFYMWRLTHDQKYREWGWEVVQALEKHCKSENGYSGIKDVYKDPPVKDDVQQSFFIAETLKYLYLLFSDDSTISLDDWVFNTEAHPLPVLSGIPKPTDPLSNNRR